MENCCVIYFGGAKICDVTNLGGAIALLCSLDFKACLLYFITKWLRSKQTPIDTVISINKLCDLWNFILAMNLNGNLAMVVKLLKFRPSIIDLRHSSLDVQLIQIQLFYPRLLKGKCQKLVNKKLHNVIIVSWQVYSTFDWVWIDMATKNLNSPWL